MYTNSFGFDPLGLLDPTNSGGFVNPQWLAYSEVGLAITCNCEGRGHPPCGVHEGYEAGPSHPCRDINNDIWL